MSLKTMDNLSSFILKTIDDLFIEVLKNMEKNLVVDGRKIMALKDAHEDLQLFECMFTEKERDACELANDFFSKCIKSCYRAKDIDECCVCFSETECKSMCCQQPLCFSCVESLTSTLCPYCRRNMGDIDYELTYEEA